MKTRELLAVLNETKTVKTYVALQMPTQYAEPVVEKIDWGERKKMKDRLFFKYSLMLSSILLAAIMLFALPMLVVYPPYGKALLLAAPPMFLIGISWMAGAWWAWDKARSIFAAVTVGATPIRLAICLTWAAMVLSITDVNQSVFVLSMMLYWVLFTFVEIAMVVKFTKKIKFTAQLEPNDQFS
jgi:hypothetical protein